MDMYEIRNMRSDELYESLALIRNVFLEFEAPDYSDEGVQTFLEFIDHKNIQQGIDDGDLKFWVCSHRNGIVGVLAVKEGSHICMLFVDKSFHRQGIASKLLKKAFEHTDPETEITVNSSPYEAPFYHSAGFRNVSKRKITNGIEYIPMKASCSKILESVK